jgi:tripartite-type tricarboxylate transporter receptor subunit TctC
MTRLMSMIAGAVLALAALAPPVAAQGYPAKPVRLLVPYPAGGAVDILGRLLGQHLSGYWSQQVVIENKPGAGGVIATEALLQTPPDGYTLILIASGHAVNPSMYGKLSYDINKDFTAICQIAWAPNIVLVNKDQPFKTLGELLDKARAEPGKLSYGMPGFGTSPHLSGELLKYMAKVDIVSIPYKGGAPTLNDLIAGQIPMSINNIPESIAQIRAGAVRPLAVTSIQRSPVLPEIPTVAEAANLAGYDTPVWWGVLAPAGLPAPIVEKLHADLIRTLGETAVKERLASLGATAIGSTPAAFDALIKRDAEKWAPVVKAANIKPE